MAHSVAWSLVIVSVLLTLTAVPAAGVTVAPVYRALTQGTESPSHTIYSYTSPNWAGYVAKNKTGHTTSSVTKVAGTFVMPTLTCGPHGSTYVSVWVGIDGEGSPTVEQTGGLGQCISGVVSYYLWWEMYPGPTNPISTITLHAGDTIKASVTWSPSTHFHLKISDGSKSFSTTQSQSPTAKRVSAECIVERPGLGGSLTHLAKFGSAKFSTCTATVGGVSGAIGTFPYVEQTAMKGTSKIIATVSGLTSHKAFTVTWKGYS